MALFRIMMTGLPVQVKKNILEFEIVHANTSRFAPCRIRLKMCVEMKEQAQVHYVGTIRAIPIPV